MLQNDRRRWVMCDPCPGASFTNMPTPGSLIFKLWLLLLGPAAGQRVVQSPSALTLLRGQTARINCSLLSGEERVDSVRYYWSRTRDNPGISGNQSRNFLKPGARLSVSDSLVIREVTVDDSDTYHCSVLRLDPSPWMIFNGNGTELDIQAKPDISLTLEPEVEAAGIHTLICAAAGFSPRDLNISWAVTGDVWYETETGPRAVNGDRTYNLSSRLRVTDTRREAGAVVTCLVQHVTGSESVRRSFSLSRGFPKYYFALLSLIFIIPFCIWIIKNQCRKRKNGKEPSVHDKNVDNQIMRKRMKDSVNKVNISLSNENLQYASVRFNSPPKGKQNKELRSSAQACATVYAALKVKDKNNLFYEEPVHNSTVNICPT